ncbi:MULTISPECIES: D-amino-acid transaminase [Bacillaceae]|jgi:D-alanine transaminase|uniref:D-amino-acid transaminase n=1 Tax=Bacillaceae TaxID=186817 RepID=UPI0011A33790|nr:MULTISPECIES: D-amino-acid transaminase [Bacillaceae]MCM3125574.1 D-amino-acid transaminase [Mesobacillus sp. MER 33]MCM3235636.1 D-amino-acid transaminase [Mesobacillus sp. MER 48]
MEYVIVDDKVLDRTEAKVDIEDRGYQFGDGVYEVIRVYNGKMFTGIEHLNRLAESAEKIRMKLPYSPEELLARMEELISKNEVETGTVYMQFTRGTSPRNHVFPGEEVATTFVAYTRKVPRPVDPMEKGVRAILDEDIRWLRCDIKSLNLLGNLLSKQKAAEAGCFEAILHRGETVTEGSHSNISIVKDGVVITHQADNHILNGISRQKVLEICRNEGIPFEERAYTLEELSSADEVFSSGTTVEVMPVVEVAGKPVGNGQPGSVTRKLQTLFKAEIERQCGNI